MCIEVVGLSAASVVKVPAYLGPHLLGKWSSSLVFPCQTTLSHDMRAGNRQMVVVEAYCAPGYCLGPPSEGFII